MAVEGVKGAKGHGIGVAEYGPGTGGQAAVGVGSLDSAFHGVFCTDDVGGVYGNPNLGARVQECLGAKTCGQVGAPGGQDCGFSAVSYTHLDVYKRQAQGYAFYSGLH